ncbi:MAG: tetratricopeptide repeat protein [Prevotella sp.]|nr:tetratricopeptide repeat protein [Prevotella sp.]MDY3965487.1 tetratricopeptide repeat protein [Prevotella sp.]
MANSKIEQGTPTMEQTLNKQEVFFLKYKKAIVVAVVAVIVIIAGSIAYNTFYAGPREDKAATAMAKAQELFAAQQYELALKGDKSFEGFLQVASNYSGTDAANLANLYAGLCYANLDKWQDAVKYLDQFSSQDDAFISPSAMAALGNAYAHTKQIDKAVSCLKKAADMANSEAKDGVNISVAPTCLMQAARLLESQNKNDEALSIYKEIKTKYVKSYYNSEIDKYIERLTK